MNPRRLYRSADDRWIAGVAAGVAEYFDVDPTIVRILWLISSVLSGGITVVAYIVMIVVVPLGPQEWPAQSPWQPGGDPSGLGGPSLGYAPMPAAGSSDPGADPNAAPAAGAPGSSPTPGAAPFGSAPTPGGAQGWDWRGQRPDRWQRRQERWERRQERRGSGGVVFGAILIVVGGLVAWHEIDPRLDLNLAWPIAIIALGVFLVVSSVGRKSGD